MIELLYDYLKGNKNFKERVNSCVLQRQVVTRLYTRMYTKYCMNTINCCFRSQKNCCSLNSCIFSHHLTLHSNLNGNSYFWDNLLFSASKKLNTVQLAHTNIHMTYSNYSCDPFKMTPGKQQSNITGVSILLI